MKDIMKHMTHLSATFLFASFLFIPLNTWGQVNLEVTPEWIRKPCYSAHSVIADIDINKNEEIYVIANNCLEGINALGDLIYSNNISNSINITYPQKYNVLAGDYIHISQGLEILVDVKVDIPGAFGFYNELTYGGVAIVSYLYSDQEPHELIMPGNTFNYPINFGSRGTIFGMDKDAIGNIYITGIYNDLLPDPLPTPPVSTWGYPPAGAIDAGADIDVFLASYTPKGILRWSRRIAGPDYDYPGSKFWLNWLSYQPNARSLLHSDDDGNTYLFGNFSAGAVFGEGQFNEVTLPADSSESTPKFDSSGAIHSALASFDTKGNLRWVRTSDDFGIVARFAEPEKMAVDVDGNIFVLWQYEDLDPALLDTFPFTDLDADDGTILAKHSTDGSLLWIRAIENLWALIAEYPDLATDARGHVYISGSFSSNSIQIEDVVLYNYDSYSYHKDGFVAHYDDSGTLLWVGHATGPSSQQISALAVSPAGDLYVAGYSITPFQLGLETVAPGLLRNRLGSFLAKYAASTITSSELAEELPAAATLMSNYPNPFTHTTTIEYALPASGPVRLAVYDALGREVATLVDGVRQAGPHAAVFDGTSLPSGVYLYRLEAAGQAKTGLMTLRR